VVQAMMDAVEANPSCALIGHNCMYDLVYFYNQFMGSLPDTYEEFAEEWLDNFPTVYDTKVLSVCADYFGKTSLSKVYDKCEKDKRLYDILQLRFDTKNQFLAYHGEGAESRCHEAAYDAFMTGYIFAKIVKYKEIDQIFLENRRKRENGQKKNGEPYSTRDPKALKDTPVNLNHQWVQPFKNKVAINLHAGGKACFPLDTSRPDTETDLLEQRQSEYVWIEFNEDLKIGELELQDLSAATISEMFKEEDLGDFQTYKETKESIIMVFYYINKDVIKNKKPAGVIQYLKKQEMMEKYKIKRVLSYDEAPKFVAHNRLE